jgi:hypothetical protein
MPEVYKALANGDPKQPCWGKLAARIDSANYSRLGALKDHPLEVLAAIARQGDSLGDSSLSTLLNQAIWHPSLLHPVASPHPELPLLRLAAAIARGHSLSQVAGAIIRAASRTTLLAEHTWWRALLNTLRECPRSSFGSTPDDRADIAEAILYRDTRNLPTEQRDAFDAARKELSDA